MLQAVLPEKVMGSDARAEGMAVEFWDGGDPTGCERWEAAWRISGGGDVFSHPGYVAAVAARGERPMCAFMRFEEGATILYAFLVRPIAEDAAGEAVAPPLYDIYTPLVYGGPLGVGVTDDQVMTFWDSMRDWAIKNRIVSEIIRFSPVDRHRLAYPGTLRRQAPHIVVDLEGCSEEDVVANLRKSTRRTYRRALDSGITSRIESAEAGVDEFLEVHAETMSRVEAHSRFSLERGFLEELHRIVPESVTYAFAVQDDVVVSAELMLFRDDSSCAYLGGTRTSALVGGATVVASVAALQESRRRGCREHVLTGGVTNTDDDSLLMYKRGLGRDGDRDYFTGEQVFLPEVYEELCRPAEGLRLRSGYFPLYRAGV